MTSDPAAVRGKGTRQYSIAAVDRALDLLEALARIGPASLAAVAEEAGCTRTAGFRLLRTLQARGFAIQDEARGAWRLGARCEAFAHAANNQGALAALALLSALLVEPIEDGQGLLVLQRPWPSMLRTLYKEDDRFVETYFSKFGKETYVVGDAARKDKDGYFWIIGRIDDVVNVSGHRMSTAEVESAIVSHRRVAEAAVIGQSDEDTGQAICAFVTLEGENGEGSDELIAEIRDHVADRIGKFARPKRIVWADDLPKTRSGKIMRRLLRDIAEGRALGDVTTLRDPDVMSQLEEKIKEEQAHAET